MSKLCAILTLLVLATTAYADYPIQPSQVPTQNVQFIKQHFKQEITFAKKDFWEIEVYLTDGTKVEFKNGNFHSAKGFNLPVSFLPSGVQKTIKEKYSNQSLTEIEAEYYGYELEFNGMLKVKISSTGSVLYQEID